MAYPARQAIGSHSATASIAPRAAPAPQAGESAPDGKACSTQDAKRKEELLAAIGTADSLPNAEQRIETLTRLCSQWAELDPRGAIDLAFDHHLDEVGHGIIENLAMQWAGVDLPAARKWTEEQPPGEARDELVARIGFVWSQSNPEAAADFVIAHSSAGPVQTEAAISVLYQWARQDPERALEWARKFPPGPLRDRAIKETLSVAATCGN